MRLSLAVLAGIIVVVGAILFCWMEPEGGTGLK
jgi:hypothetical protein